MMGKVVLLFSFFLLVTIIFFGCKKPEEHKIEYEGKASALRNGESWNTECTVLFSSQYENEVSLFIDKYNNLGEKRENLSISRIPLIIGVFEVVNYLADSVNNDITQYGSSYFSLTADGDVIDGVYYVLESHDNYIEITHIDLNTNDFVGKFEITYIRDTTFNMNPSLPDTLRFTQGKFQTKIQNNW